MQYNLQIPQLVEGQKSHVTLRKLGSIQSINLRVSASVFPARNFFSMPLTSQLAITCSKLTIETLEQGAKYVQR